MPEMVSIPLEAAKALAALHLGYWTELDHLRGVFVSDAGDVASLRSGKIRKLRNYRRGKYLAIGSVPQGPYVHQVMCETFHGPRPAGCEVRHLDGNQSNNAADNLAWGSRKQNHADKRTHGTDNGGERNVNAKLTPRAVDEMRDLRAALGLSYRVIGQRFGVSTMTAYRAVSRQSWK
jgi:hypothetical protein